MPFRMLKILCFSIVVTYALSPPFVRAQRLKLVGEIIKVFKDANDEMDKLTELQTALEQFQQGKKPNTSGDWSHIGEHFQLAAKRLRAIKSPDLRISETPLIYPKVACKSDLLARSEIYLKHLRQTQTEGGESLEVLDGQLTRIRKARNAIDQIAKLYEKLSVVPELGEAFALDWIDLVSSAPEGLAEYESAVKERRDAFKKQLDSLPLLISNLQGNMALMEKPCDEEARQQRAKQEADEKAKRDAQTQAQEQAQAKEAEAARRRAQAAAQQIPPGWVICQCPAQHAAQGRMIGFYLYHPSGIMCR